MKLIAQMVGHNEADRHLREVLTHLVPLVDDIVYTDDASTDDTPDIFEEFGAHVYRNDTQLFTVDEGALRRGAWKNLENHIELGDWVLAIDCDEKLWATTPGKSLRELLKVQHYDVLAIKFYHMWNETHYRVDKAWRPVESSRLFRYFYGGQFQDRKLACGSEPTYVRTLIQRGRFLQNTGLIMQHLGYVRDEDKRAKYDRYMAIDGGDFHAKAHLESILDPNPELVEWK